MTGKDKSSLPTDDSGRQSAIDWVALASLVGAGGMLGVSTNLAKVAAGMLLPPAPYLAGSCILAGSLLLGVTRWKRVPLPVGTAVARYATIAGFLSLAAPNLLAFHAVPQVGVGFVALAIAFPPLLTWLGAVGLGLERFDGRRGLAVLMALAGAVWLAFAKLGAGRGGGDILWVAVALAVPVLLAGGNLYRTLAWPEGARPDALAPEMLLASALLIAVAMALGLVEARWPDNIGQWALIGLQGVAFAVQYHLFFVLQRRSGPVLLSLMGSVAAVIAIPVAVFVLQEEWPDGLVVGGSLIAAGVAMMAWQRQPRAAD